MTNVHWRARVEEIPGGEWWHASGKEAFEEVFLSLVAKGFSENEAIAILEKVYTAVANEFGN